MSVAEKILVWIGKNSFLRQRIIFVFEFNITLHCTWTRYWCVSPNTATFFICYNTVLWLLMYQTHKMWYCIHPDSHVLRTIKIQRPTTGAMFACLNHKNNYFTALNRRNFLLTSADCEKGCHGEHFVLTWTLLEMVMGSKTISFHFQYLKKPSKLHFKTVFYNIQIL